MTSSREFVGRVASPGIAFGQAYVLNRELASQSKASSEDLPNLSWDELVGLAREEVKEIKQKVESEVGSKEAEIFSAHLLMLEDPELNREITEESAAKPLREAIALVFDRWIETFRSLSDAYLRERSQDLKDLKTRLLRILSGGASRSFELQATAILVAEDLYPSDFAQINKDRILGLVLRAGGTTSHTAIMARTLNIPAIVGVKDLDLESLVTSTTIASRGSAVIGEAFIDAEQGKFIISPNVEEKRTLHLKMEKYRQLSQEWKQFEGKRTKTGDSLDLAVSANIGSDEDLPLVKRAGAEGVGLFRTEFLFMERSKPPTEDEQYECYRKVVEACAPFSAKIRTLDIGGDKSVPYLKLPKEENPFLGMRSVRYSLKNQDLFREQLRALLRASAHGSLGIMFPMITTLEELALCQRLIEFSRADLSAKGKRFGNVQIGIMVEVPAVASCCDLFLDHVDFLSIGSNDLIQYACGVDRLSESVASLYDPLHPGVLRLIANVIEAGEKRKKDVGLCGEMASQFPLTPLLLGMGLKGFSVNSSSVGRLRYTLSRLNTKECQALWHRCQKMSSALAIREELKNWSKANIRNDTDRTNESPFDENDYQLR